MRVERIVLEDHGDVAVFRRHVVDDAAVNGDRAAADLLQPGDHAQRGGFTATRRSDQHDELAVLNFQIDVFHGLHAAGKNLGHVFQNNFGHGYTLC